MKKTILTLLYAGFTLGFILGVILCAVIVTVYMDDGSLHLFTSGLSGYIENPLLAFLTNAFSCGVLGMVMMGTMAVYEIDEWDLLKVTTVHFLVSVTGFYLTAFFLRWFTPDNISAVCTSLIIFVLIYVGIWMTQYLAYKSQIKEINQWLNIKKSTNA